MQVRQYLRSYRTEFIETNNTSQPDNMTNWKTYRNEEYGFEFRYPPTLEYEEIRKQGDQIFVPSYISLSKYPVKISVNTINSKDNNSYNTAENEVKELFNKFTIEERKLGNYSFTIVNILDAKGFDAYAFVKSPTTNLFVKFVLGTFEAIPEPTPHPFNRDDFYQILSTFKFTDEGQVQGAES